MRRNGKLSQFTALIPVDNAKPFHRSIPSHDDYPSPRDRLWDALLATKPGTPAARRAIERIKAYDGTWIIPTYETRHLQQ